MLVRGEGDLDGDGASEPLALYADGRLVAGEAEGEAELTDGNAYFMEKPASLDVVAVERDTGLRGVLVGLPTEEQTDPPNRYQLFVAEDGALRRVFDRTVGAYGVVVGAARPEVDRGA